MKSKVRIYAVTGESGKARLVTAANQTIARNHVVKETIEVHVASQSELVALIGQGVQVEVAGDENE